MADPPRRLLWIPNPERWISGQLVGSSIRTASPRAAVIETQMIDFQNLEMLPVRRQKDRDERERLAEASFKKKAAKHKGRPHFWAYQKRQRKAAAAARGQARAEASASAYSRYIDEVRAYWLGLRSDHPAKP